ncbi:MAG TPA: hypothetical protein VIF64_08365, partial [Pyrinomonadaceae bacterium]
STSSVTLTDATGLVTGMKIQVGIINTSSPAGIENMLLLSKTGTNTFNVARGWDGTSATSFSAGTPAIVEGGVTGVMNVNGSDTIYRDFEVTYTGLPRAFTYYVFADAQGRIGARPEGFEIAGPRTKFINLVVHDNREAFDIIKEATDVEFYGNVVYNNGQVDTMRGHGHGLYMQNDTGTKKVTDNISANNFATGMKAFGVNGFANNIEYTGNISLGNGTPAEYQGSPAAETIETNIFAGTGSNPLHNIKVISNFVYHKDGTAPSFGNMGMGWNEDTANISLTVQNNYIAGGNIPLRMRGWSSATVTGNTMYGSSVTGQDNNGVVDIITGPATSRSYTFNNNTYYYSGSSLPFIYDTARDFSTWKSLVGDGNSTYTAGRPTGIKVFVRPNLYQAGRAHIVIYNWNNASSVNVDLSSVGLSNGQSYEIRNALNYFGAPVFSGTYSASNPVISLSMTSAAATAVVTPINHSFTPATTLPQFGVFVVVPR